MDSMKTGGNDLGGALVAGEKKKPNWCSVAHTKKKAEAQALGRMEAILYYAEAMAHRRRLKEEDLVQIIAY